MKPSFEAVCLGLFNTRLTSKYFKARLIMRVCNWSTRVAIALNFRSTRTLRAMHEVARPHLSARDLAELSRRQWSLRKYLRHLQKLGPQTNLIEQLSFKIDGQAHLDGALSTGHGAVLLSGHNYGFSRFVAPILASRGYSVTRTGAYDMAKFNKLWGSGEGRRWRYIYLDEQPLGRLRALKQISELLKRNEVVHMMVLGRPCGESELEVKLYERVFFLDGATFRLLDELGSTVLPCFALSDSRGTLDIRIHPPLSSAAPGWKEDFALLFTDYMNRFPEFVRFWKPMLGRHEEW
jgi:lauroyl/myristoyl acyltransferase